MGASMGWLPTQCLQGGDWLFTVIVIASSLGCCIECQQHNPPAITMTVKDQLLPHWHQTGSQPMDANTVSALFLHWLSTLFFNYVVPIQSNRRSPCLIYTSTCPLLSPPYYSYSTFYMTYFFQVRIWTTKENKDGFNLACIDTSSRLLDIYSKVSRNKWRSQ